MTPEISVVIPTFNRAATLSLCLQALEAQGLASERAEIIVINDGSSDTTPALLAAVERLHPFHVRALHQANAGPAEARNAGVRAARAPIVVLLDDDILAGPDLLREHLEWHRRDPDPLVAVLGFVGWSERVAVSPFMRFIDSNGLQFGYGALAHGQRLDFRHFYACNLSLKRDLLLAEGFDARFPGAAFEDIELGYRLEKLGLRLCVNFRARAEHYRTVTFAQFRHRMRRAGASLRLLHQLHPELRAVLHPPRRRGSFTVAHRAVGARLASLLPAARREVLLASYWRAALTDAMARGYTAGS